MKKVQRERLLYLTLFCVTCLCLLSLILGEPLPRELW